MADTHGHDDGKDPHDSHEPPEEDVVRTPLWLPFVGIGLLLVGALASYLWVYPGRLNVATETADGGAEASSADGSAPAIDPNSVAPAAAH